jgi:hypothetical protein
MFHSILRSSRTIGPSKGGANIVEKPFDAENSGAFTVGATRNFVFPLRGLTTDRCATLVFDFNQETV